MSRTTNIDLELTDDATTNFKNWREAINGVNNSNMVKIDTAVGGKADSSSQVEVTLLASAWTGVDSPFTQTLTVTGLKATQNGTIAVAQSATAAQREAAREALLSLTGQRNGELDVVADGEMPEVDIPVVVTLLG